MNRRLFLSTSALAGTWSLLSPHSRAAGANGSLRVAVVGFNNRGKGLMEELIKCKNVTLVALCDADTAVLDRVAADVGKRGIKVAKFTDFRKLCESKEVDALVIATPNHTHALIAATAAAHGKHSYVEKPVSHNVWEGRELAKAAQRHKVIIQSGFQRRSETGWEEAVAWVREGNLGKMTLSRGFCYKPRPSIGKVSAPVAPPATVDYDLWAGPRETAPIRRKQFHYDWHWQFDYGNGDLGNQGPHQLDVCRWFLGDPTEMPKSVLSAGARLGYDDDGEWANTQIVWLDYAPVPILFEVRGLPKKNVDFKSGMDSFKGQTVGNIIECEGGWLAGGHGARCDAFDKDGKKVKSFSGGRSHMQNFIDAVHAGKIEAIRAVESGHLSSALAHIGNISWRMGAEATPDAARTAFAGDANAADAFDRMAAHFDANGIDLAKTPLKLGLPLQLDGRAETFTGPNAEAANAWLKGSYRKGFELPG
jgi:predicted dehydrogenase